MVGKGLSLLGRKNKITFYEFIISPLPLNYKEAIPILFWAFCRISHFSDFQTFRETGNYLKIFRDPVSLFRDPETSRDPGIRENFQGFFPEKNSRD